MSKNKQVKTMETLRKKYEALGEDVSLEKRNLTKAALIRRAYMPTLILEVDDFFSFTKEDMLAEYKRVAALDADSAEIKSVVAIKDPLEVKKTHLTMLLYAFEQLSMLRKDDPDAWLLVNELYEDD